MRSYLFPALIGAALLVGCGSEVDNKPASSVSDAPAAADAEEPAKTAKTDATRDKAGKKVTVITDDGAGEQEVTLKHAGDLPSGAELADVAMDESKLEFVGAKVTGDHTGGFKTFAGEVAIVGDKVVSTAFSFDLTSLYSDKEKLTKHLKSPDFFDVGKYAQATFASTEIKEGSDVQGATHTVAGTLDFHGAKKTLTFPASIAMGEAKLEGEQVKAVLVKSEFTMKRSDWGVSYPGKPDDLIKDEVLVKLDMVFPADFE